MTDRLEPTLKERTTRTGRPLVQDSFSALFMLSNTCKRGRQRVGLPGAVTHQLVHVPQA